MKVFALCTYRVKEAVGRATGVQPLTSPPALTENIGPLLHTYQEHDLWYIRLHGAERYKDVWFGEETQGQWVPALNSDQIKGLDLRGTVIVAATCFSAQSDFMRAFLDAGAGAVIAGTDYNYGSTSGRVLGADTLVRWIIRGMNRGFSAKRAFRLAQLRMTLTAWRYSDRDALRFKWLKGENNYA